jgi:hypothetical protein
MLRDIQSMEMSLIIRGTNANKDLGFVYKAIH